MRVAVSIIVLSILIISGILNAQNITNTLGANGIFKIKDGLTDYLSLDQSTGNITFYRNLELGGVTSSPSTVGVITKSGIRFIHNFSAPGAPTTNTFLGLYSGNFDLSDNSYYNTAVGYLALNQLTDGRQNCAFGFISLRYNTTGNSNSAFGVSSLESNTIGNSNSAFGNFAMRFNTEGNNNSAFGSATLLNNLTGSSNSAFGVSSLLSNTSGNSNSAFGHESLRLNTSGITNSAFGYRSLYSNTYAPGNSAFGYQTLYSNTTGNSNSAFGWQSLFNSNGDNNCAFGSTSLYYNSGNGNSAFGNASLYHNTSARYNSAFGMESLYYNNSGYPNSAFGSFSLQNNTTGRENTAVGYKALNKNILGFQNTAIGDSALYNNIGNYNTAIGYNAGSNVTTGANLTLIGIDANPSSPTSIDQITLGNQFVQSLRCNVQTITSLSDVRDKKNIKDLTLGLDFITKLKPRQFNWDRREWYDGNVSDGSKMLETPTAGFIAQEFDEVQNTEQAEWLNLVLKDNPEKWEATYGNLLPVIVKAIQELNEKNDQLKIENEKLKLEVENLLLLKQQVAEMQDFKTELIEQIKLLKIDSNFNVTNLTLAEPEVK